jgi:hypothetical protein
MAIHPKKPGKNAGHGPVRKLQYVNRRVDRKRWHAAQPLYRIRTQTQGDRSMESTALELLFVPILEGTLIGMIAGSILLALMRFIESLLSFHAPTLTSRDPRLVEHDRSQQNGRARESRVDQSSIKILEKEVHAFRRWVLGDLSTEKLIQDDWRLLPKISPPRSSR